jgi:hypothetical protein
MSGYLDKSRRCTEFSCSFESGIIGIMLPSITLVVARQRASSPVIPNSVMMAHSIATNTWVEQLTEYRSDKAVLR